MYNFSMLLRASSNIDIFRYNLPLYWFSNQFSLTGWNTGSSLIAVGLVSDHRYKSGRGMKC